MGLIEQKSDWEQKYRTLSRDMESLEQQSEDIEKELRLLVNYFAVALEGESPQLDSSIKSLKAVLKQPCADNIPSLSKLCRQIENQVREREFAKSAQIKRVVEALHQWVRALKQQLNDADSLAALGQLDQRSNGLEDNFFDLPSVLSELVTLQSSVELARPLSALDNEEEFSIDSDGLQGVPHNQEVAFLLSRVGTELLELISSLRVSNSETPAAKKLIHEIESNFQLKTLPNILQNVVTLVASSNSNAQEDFENYLLELSSRLLEVQTFIQHSQKEQQESSHNQQELDKSVRFEVQQLRDTVKETDDLGVLKNTVSRQLTGLVQAMDAFKKKEEEREERLQGRYESLIDKVEEMEMEALKLKAHMDEEYLRARTDPLTGLPNRAAYDEQTAHELARWKRTKEVFSVAVCDLDYFKKINDNYGHLAGDKVLRLVARVITKNIRTIDFACRFGGEEFVVMMPSTAIEGAMIAIDKVRQKLESSPFNFHGKPVKITMSFGVTEIQDGDDLDDLFARADQALYKAKENGRNRGCSL